MAGLIQNRLVTPYIVSDGNRLEACREPVVATVLERYYFRAAEDVAKMLGQL